MTFPSSWDLFCRVVDNYGDIGVCWRLARRLASRGDAVRLWLDDLASLAMLAPAADPERALQRMDGIEVHRWTADFPAVRPADVCVEGFGCRLPERYVEAMAVREPRPLWIVLEYLSAEPWVRSHHGLASPHPREPVPRYFFFPGFEPGTGGLLREPDLLARCDAYDADARKRYWNDSGFDAPPDGTRVASIFAYPGAPLLPLLDHWADGEEPWVVAVPAGGLATAAAQWCGMSVARAGASARRGAVELRIVPFVPQVRYDETLWSADAVFVRGEDSFVRAQWAARPFVWHIYPQDDRAHERKLGAFLDLYCADLPTGTAAAVRGLWQAWNQSAGAPVPVGPAWNRFWDHRPVIEAHARRWAQHLARPGELAENLAEFCRDKLKY